MNDLVIKQNNSTLADGTPTAFVLDGLVINGTRAIDVATFLRATSVTIFDRLTTETEVRFRIARTHADLTTALDHVIFVRQNLAGKANLVIEFTETATTYSAVLANAGWKATSAKTGGVSTEVEYSVTGGLWTSSTRPSSSTGVSAIDGGSYGSSYGPIPGIIDGGNYDDGGVPTNCAVEAPAYS